MSFPNLTDIVATTIQNRSKAIADNVTFNNALSAKLQQRGNVKTFSGGNTIMRELSFTQNGNGGWYSGYDLLPVAAQDVISAAEYSIKQLACPIVMSGLEQLQNAGREQMIDLLEGRITVAESTMANLLAGGVYADGTGSGGKELTGLNAAIPSNPATGTYGGIDRATWAFWRSKIANRASLATPGPITAANIAELMNFSWANLVRGADRPDLVIFDNVLWKIYLASLQNQQRFTQAETGKLGFPSLKYMDADVVLDGGIGGFCPASTGFMLNTKYLFLMPHAARNMVPLSPNRRYAINQDAEVQILAWAGNLATSGAQFQGRLMDA
jgi:hypothetical protein